MSRNNSDRTGPPIKPAQQPVQNSNPLLNFVKPTNFVTLPSKGKHYADNHPLKDQEVIEVYQMTAKDEDILTSESLIKNGIVIDRFVENIIVNKSISIDSLLIGDKNAILLESRKLGYGAEYDTEVMCPSCFETNTLNYDLNEANINFGSEAEINENGNFIFELPETKIKLELKLLTSKDESLIFKRMTDSKKNKSNESAVTDQYKLMVVSANGVTDRGQLNEFIEVLPLKDSISLKKYYKKVTPNIDMKFDFTCKSCGYEQELEVPLGAEFFWPKR
jgi:hypothetical protein